MAERRRALTELTSAPPQSWVTMAAAAPASGSVCWFHQWDVTYTETPRKGRRSQSKTGSPAEDIDWTDGSRHVWLPGWQVRPELPCTLIP
ncbi:hypothetical protein BCV69DRAFT_151750 [Microstroma glucosiphilum]|uniref:Uncharacterized protein n=1 Tax=Pseudomicrostroma glucosiphilum TaxID=1684307 RepID=A0A316UEW6_9BASI|nr:hypothetical protein BCV69DRAFT_151750 [Pseudomicrostroma glucosiphilum]PWN21665.1 hypothetical protein BCV69DRAFT_151750 [Pseudomicrostroma glucosiphilum]